MGILKGREELIPVTCAVLKDSDRDAFFSQIRRNRAGAPEELARWLAVPAGLVNDWIGGRAHIPYHTLQNIAYQFSVEMPAIGELRRESLPAAQLPSAKPPAAASGPGRGKEARRTPRVRKPRPARVERPRSQKVRAEKPAKPGRRAPHREPSGPRWPKPSGALAYWSGILYAAAEVQGDALSFSADRRIGQNFAAGWAKKTQELFGTACRLEMIEDGNVQKASCEIPGLREYLGRMCPGAGSGAEQVSLPRWIWSNPEWKSAGLKGLADVSARFHRRPYLSLDVPRPLSRSVERLLDSLGFKPQTQEGRENVFMIAGRGELDRYFGSVGTENMKLRDQWTSFCRSAPGAPGPDLEEGGPQPQPSQTPEAGPEPRSRSSQAPQAEPPPAHRRKPARPRRTVFRGRPGP